MECSLCHPAPNLEMEIVISFWNVYSLEEFKIDNWPGLLLSWYFLGRFLIASILSSCLLSKEFVWTIELPEDQVSSKVFVNILRFWDLFHILIFMFLGNNDCGTKCPYYLEAYLMAPIIATLESQQNLVMEMLKPLLYCTVLYLQFLQEDV